MADTSEGPCKRMDLDNDDHYKQVLLDRSDNLFLTGKASIETDLLLDVVWQQRQQNNNCIERAMVTTESGLRSLLEAQSFNHSDAYIFVRQDSSWSPLRISLKMFHMISQHFTICPAFIEVLSEIGLKTSEVIEQLPICFPKFHYSKEELPSPLTCEITYNLYHVEKHGRPGLKDPWSVRQTAVYHKFCLDKGTSTWLFVQLSKPIHQILEAAMSGERCDSANSDAIPLHPFAVHILILVSSQRNWKGYIQYLIERVAKFHEIAYFSEVGQKSGQSFFQYYALEFADCQSAELLHRKIRRALSIIQAQMRILQAIKAYHDRIQKSATNLYALDASSSIILELRLRECHTMIQNFVYELRSLLKSAESTQLLLFKILDHRNDAVIHDNGHSLQKLAQKSTSQSELILSMAELARYDSRTMRIVSFVAKIYLPISLVSSFFSSNIVQLASRDIASSNVELQKEVGVFVIVTVILTGMTVAGAMYWERKERLSTTQLPSNRLPGPGA